MAGDAPILSPGARQGHGSERPRAQRNGRRTYGSIETSAWLAGIVFVVAVVAETVVGTGFGVTQNDSATKVAEALHDHRTRVLIIAAISVLFAPAFVVYLNGLDHVLREDEGRNEPSARWCWWAGCCL